MKKKEIEFPFQFYMRSIVHNVKRFLDTHLKPYDISSQQARIVGLIYEKEIEGVRLCQTDIEGLIGISGASVTSLLQGLEKKGFIQRTTSSSDERIKELTLMHKGQELINEFKSVFIRTEKKITQGMTDEQKELYLQLLQLINKTFENAAACSPKPCAKAGNVSPAKSGVSSLKNIKISTPKESTESADNRIGEIQS